MSKKPKRKNKRDRQVSTMRSGHGLGAISDVPTFRNKINADLGLSKKQRLRLVTQAEVLVRELYVHLHLKNAMHSIDPLQRLRLLAQRVSELSIVAFHAELMDIFKDLRDLHTNLSLPKPFGLSLIHISEPTRPY